MISKITAKIKESMLRKNCSKMYENASVCGEIARYLHKIKATYVFELETYRNGRKIIYITWI